MGRVIKKCKICGKEYEACHTLRRDNVFKWQDVACCPEHGAQYLHDVLVARGELKEAPPVTDDKEVVEKTERKATRSKKKTSDESPTE